MEASELTMVNCPYCGQAFAVEVDHTGSDEQEWMTDCEVCCRPVLVKVHHAHDETCDLDVLQEQA